MKAKQCLAGYPVLLALVPMVSNSLGADVRIHWFNTRSLEYYFRPDVPPGLSPGTSAGGDGTLLQLGYYTMATASNPFAGSWVTLASATIGDAGVDQAGRFEVTSVLTGGTFDAPSAGSLLAVRFFDGATVEQSEYFNVATSLDPNWKWPVSPDGAPLSLEINKEISIFQGSAGSAFKASISIANIPEPSGCLLLAGATVLALRRNRGR